MVTRSQMTQFVPLVFVMGLLVTCGPTPRRQPVGPISVQPNTITVGEKAILKVEVAGTNLRFEWKARRGKIEKILQGRLQHILPLIHRDLIVLHSLLLVVEEMLSRRLT